MHDGAEAVQWFRKAADQGNVDAQNSLAFMYITGQGVRQDDAEASRWYRKAADQGNADAQYNLGVLYAKGRGVAQDYLLAQVWVNLALSRTLTDKRSKWMETRDIITKKMTSAQIAEAQRLVLEWKPKEQR
jgi:TPR repeat protein